MTKTRTGSERTERIRHETRALLRAHLSAASGYRHLTRHCPVCHRLLRLAQEAGSGAGDETPARAEGVAERDTQHDTERDAEGPAGAGG
ncbi:DUF6274 family protein [Streptomyces syringium]|uniref:DUF6274 family protein n=1 Tax=Streptomyces syringium TaxID=76729 RepID=UPI00367A0A1D